MIITVMLVFIAVIAYCLGSINGAVLTSRYVFHRDVRDMGSGNAGLANFYRNFGTRGLAMMAGIDIVKGLLAAAVGGWLLALTSTASAPVDFAVIGRLFATFCLVIGHIFPVFHHFRGGKGVLCGVAAAFCVDWRAGAVCLVVFLVFLVAFRYTSLGSMTGALALPITVAALGFGGLAVTLAAFSAILIIIAHRSNITRLLNHTEPKLELKKDVTHKLDEEDF